VAFNEAAEADPDLLPHAAIPGADTLGGLAELGRPMALHLEMQPPPSSVARGLRLRAGQPAAMVTVRFDDPVAARPVALTVAALRPDLFRIVIDSPSDSSPIKNVSVSDAFDETPASPGVGASTSIAGSSGDDHSGVNETPISFSKT
jgi:hypothetical protein